MPRAKKRPEVESTRQGISPEAPVWRSPQSRGRKRRATVTKLLKLTPEQAQMLKELSTAWNMPASKLIKVWIEDQHKKCFGPRR